MGNDCSNYPPPDPDATNQCSKYASDVYRMPGFCAESGVGGKNNRITWCQRMSTAGEWAPQDTNGSGSCHYDSCATYRAVPSDGCCNGCCGITGSGVNCKRKQFAGDPLACCMKDLECNGGTDDASLATNPPACFSDTSQQDTCSPCYRSLTSDENTIYDATVRNDGTITNVVTCGDIGNGGCQEVMLNYCVGADIPTPNPDPSAAVQELASRWYDSNQGTPGPCTIALERNLFQNLPSKCLAVGALPYTSTCRPLFYPGSTLPGSDGSTAGTPVTALSADGVEWAQAMFPQLIAKYNDLGFSLGSVPGGVGYNPFQDYLYSLCCQVPVMCQSTLENSCAIYTAQRLSVNPDATNWCGCYLPDSEYQKYVDAYQVNKECTPTCNRSTTIPLVNGANAPILCNQTICIIDDVTINLSNSTVNGGINVSQICGNCSGTFGSQSSCSCIIQNTTIDGAQSNLGNINLNTVCSSSTCTVTNPGYPDLPATLEVPCDQTTDPDTVYAQAQAALEAEQAAQNKQTIIIYLVIIVIFFVIMLVIYFLIRPELRSPPADRILYPRPTPAKTTTVATPAPSQPPLYQNRDIGTRSLSTIYGTQAPSTGPTGFFSNAIGSRTLD